MAVAVDVVGTHSAHAATTSISYSFAPSASIANPGLVIALMLDSATVGPTITSPTWNGAACTQIVTHSVAAGGGVYLFGLVGSSVQGSHTFTATISASSTYYIYGISFSGVDQTGGTTSFPHSSSATTSSNTSLGLTITTAVGNFTVSIAGAGTGSGPTGTLTSNGTITAEDWEDVSQPNSSGGTAAAGHSTISSGTSITWTGHNGVTNDFIDIVATDILAAAGAAPFVQKDWPVPTPPNREPGLLSWIQDYNLLLYQGKDQLPVRQQEWQVPRSVEPYPYRSWEAKYNPNLIGKDVLPKNQLEWQVPRSPEPYPYRSWETFYNRNLIGKDKFYDGPGNVPDFDWQVPRSPEPFPYRTWSQNLLQTTLAPSLAKPFAQYDWQIPVGAEPNWRRSWEFWFNYNLIGKDQFPVRQLDWQLPPRSVETYPYRSWEAKYNPNLVGQDVFPVRQLDWQVPTAPPKIDQTWIVNLQLSTLAPVVTTLPFRQFDWPLPQGYAPIVQAGNQPLNLNLQPTFVMLPFQWDIVEGPPFAAPWSAPNLLLTNLIGQDQLPISQKDWQLPQTPQYVERTIAQNLLLTTLAPPVSTAMPFRQLDWRLPDFFLQ